METSNEKKDPRGGRREGAGRKPLGKGQKKTTVTFSLSHEGQEALSRYATAHGISKSQAIETVFLSLVKK